MCIFYAKSLDCGCVVIAWHFRRDKNIIILSGHSYKIICNKCLNLTDDDLDKRLNKFKNNNYKLYSNENSVLYSNGWKNLTDYTFKQREFDINCEIDIN